MHYLLKYQLVILLITDFSDHNIMTNNVAKYSGSDFLPFMTIAEENIVNTFLISTRIAYYIFLLYYIFEYTNFQIILNG